MRAPPSKELKQDVFNLREEGSQNILQTKNPPLRARVRAETRTCGTDSPSRSKSREPSITPSHHPQKKDGSMTDFKHTQSDPHGSYRKMSHALFTHLPPGCALTFSPLPKGQPVKRLRAPPSKELKQEVFNLKEEGSQNILQMKNPLKARVRVETRTCGTDSPSRSKSREPSITSSYHSQK